MMDLDRMKHSLAVANKMVEIGKEDHLSDKKLEELFLLGLVHDIGYRFGDNDNHSQVGGEILKKNGYLYWAEVFYHGQPDCEYTSYYLDILNLADNMIDRYGNDVGFDNRAKDIKSRYGENSIQYQNCIKIINKLTSKEENNYENRN